MARRLAGRVRALAVNLTLAALSILIVFGGVEAILRLTALAPSRALRSADGRTLDRIPGLYQPGQEFTDRVRRDLPARIRIGNLGFRGRDLDEAKAPGTLRILALGDSYTFGDHVDTEEAYPARLEEALELRLRRVPVEVVNAGVNGFGILDEIALWRKAGSRLDPDAVLLTFSPNDISDMTRPAPVIDQMRRHAAVKGRPIVGPAIRVAQNTAIFNGLQILAARIRVATRSHAAIPGVEPSRAGPAEAPWAWEAYREALVRFGRLLGSDGRRAILVHYPSYGNVTGEDRAHAAEVLPAWAAEAGFEYLDLLPAFRQGSSEGAVLYLVPRDSHPSPAGHSLAARRIAEALGELGWLTASVPGA